MTTLPPNYLRLSSKWLETNPLPEDALAFNNGMWHGSACRGMVVPHPELYPYATARTDLPREAYADDEIRPMTAEECKALDEFTMNELRSEPTPDLTQPLSEIGQEQWEGVPDSEPGAEVASERAEVPVPCSTNSVWPMTDKVFIEYARWSLSRPNHGDAHELIDHALKRPKTMREHAMELESTIATLRAQLEAEQAKRKDTARDFETAFRLVREENDKLRAEVEEAKEKYTAEERLRWQNVSADFKRALDEKARLTAELDAVRKELELEKRRVLGMRQTGEELQAELDAAQARCGALERAIRNAPHTKECHEMRQRMPLDALRNGVCQCWKFDYRHLWAPNKIPTPSQQPDNLDSSGGIGRRTSNEADRLARAEDSMGVQVPPAVNPSSPEPVKAGEWLPSLLPMPTQYGEHPHDMVIGPCACGATHKLTDWPKEVQDVIRALPPIAPEGKATEGEG